MSRWYINVQIQGECKKLIKMYYEHQVNTTRERCVLEHFLNYLKFKVEEIY
jgi:hypothetical protein